MKKLTSEQFQSLGSLTHCSTKFLNDKQFNSLLDQMLTSSKEVSGFLTEAQYHAMINRLQLHGNVTITVYNTFEEHLAATSSSKDVKQ